MLIPAAYKVIALGAVRSEMAGPARPGLGKFHQVAPRRPLVNKAEGAERHRGRCRPGIDQREQRQDDIEGFTDGRAATPVLRA